MDLALLPESSRLCVGTIRAQAIIAPSHMLLKSKGTCERHEAAPQRLKFPRCGYKSLHVSN